MKINFKRLNQFGVSHILIPIVAFLVVGGIGSYIAFISRGHADAAVPYLTCSASFNKTTVGRGSYFTVTQRVTNTGGGYGSGTLDNYLSAGGGDFTFTSNEVQDGVKQISGILHGQTYTYSFTLGPWYAKSPTPRSIKVWSNIDGRYCTNAPRYLKFY